MQNKLSLSHFSIPLRVTAESLNLLVPLSRLLQSGRRYGGNLLALSPGAEL